MRALITGGAGFIGSHLGELLLSEGVQVHVVDDLSSGSMRNLETIGTHEPRLSFAELDIRDPTFADEVASFRPHVVFHLAAQASVAVSIAKPVLDASINLVGTLNVLEACHQHEVGKVVFAASGGTLYGELPPFAPPADETALWRPSSPYGFTKRAVLDYLAFYRDNLSLDAVAVALANVYGPRQDPFGEAGVIAIFSHLAACHQPLVIYGDGTQTRDFVHVWDVARAFVAAGTHSSPPICNIGSGTETSVNEVARCVREVSCADVGVEYRPARPGEVRRSVLDSGLANRALGWAPSIRLEDGIADIARGAGEALGLSAAVS